MKQISYRSGYRHYLYKIAIAAALAAWFGIFPACQTAPSGPPLPNSEWGESYSYSADLSGLPTSAAASVPVTIAVVNPTYKEDESSLATPLYNKIGKGFAVSMGTDLDKILIAKGVTTTGPFPSLDEITYSEKKDAALALAPRVFVTAEVKYDDGSGSSNGNAGMGMFGGAAGGNIVQRSVGMTLEKHFVMHISGWVSFIMQEPLSGEKMWIKKLELDPVDISGVEIYGASPVYASDGCGGQRITGYGSSGNLLFDGKTDAMASALKRIYPIVINQFQKYLDPNEMVNLKSKGEEIRKAKVY